jgi:hypothetical protein
MFPFENIKATKHSLIENGLSQSIWVGLPRTKTQNQKRNNKDQKRRKRLNLLKNMKNIQMNLQM